MIDQNFIPYNLAMIKDELSLKRAQNQPYDEVHCIMPFHYKKDIESSEMILGMYGDVRLSCDETEVYVYPARDFPSGETNECGKICYVYPADKFPELYSFENITAGYQIAMAMGGIINMENPMEKLKYIYDFAKTA